MTSSIDLNRTLLAPRDAIRCAVERCTPPAADHVTSTIEGAAVETGLLDVASFCEGFLVRVTIPKRDWARLVLETASVLAVGQASSTNDPATSAAVEEKKAELKAQLERGGSTFYRVGVVRSVVLHVVQQGQPATAYLLVDLGEAQETFSLKQVCERVDDCPEEELLLLQRLTVIHKKPFLAMERHAVLRRRLDALLTHCNAHPTATVPAGAFYCPSSRQHPDPTQHAGTATATTQGSAEGPNGSLLLQQQRDIIAQLQQDVEKKNHELYLMSLRMREQQQTSDAQVKAVQTQMAALAEVNASQIKAAQDRDAKIRPLLDTVKALHPLLKLAREKLSLPQGSLEDVERALREATVVPRGAKGNTAP